MVLNKLFFKKSIYLSVILLCYTANGDSSELLGAEQYHEDIKPIFEMYCYMCHAGGQNEGGMSFDALQSDEEILNNKEHWWAVLKNVRAGIMPPNGLLRPEEEEYLKIKNWIEQKVFEIDPENPDPGHVTLRRLNRVEYRNTINDLMGVDYNSIEEFPPDDTGYGFDTIGDVLSVSSLLLEKYVTAAENIVSRAVPAVTKVMPSHDIRGWAFKTEDGEDNGDAMTFYDDIEVSHTFNAKHPGTYTLALELEVDGSFDFDPGRCNVSFTINGKERFREEFVYHSGRTFVYEFEEQWEPGEQKLSFKLTPLVDQEQQRNKLDFEINTVTIKGPASKDYWNHPPNYKRFFHRDELPIKENELEQYAFEVLDRFTTKAYRRPTDKNTINKLVAIAKQVYELPDKTFEEGIAQSMTAVLASPRFLFRTEETEPIEDDKTYPLIDEYALASRLSYFFWSTMPDDELFALAEKNELRDNLESQVQRMIRDDRIEEFIENFTGQWLQARDIEHIPINVRAALDLPRRRRGEERLEFERSLRRAMRQETELFFTHIIKEDRSMLDLLDSDYTFLNAELAKHYEIDGVEGNDMRLVKLNEDSKRGGVLTQGTMLAVTSNPTRTSPVKRGVFILDNILGTPAPPAPPNIPELEAAKESIENENPTMRELMELHRKDPMCASCHKRFDPLGLALENFNAMGMWRDEEKEQPINASGQLITGETFNNIEELKQILIKNHKESFYRCMVEKLMTYAIGRGPEYYDEYTLDTIVERMLEHDGRFSALLMGVIESAPFQRQRTRTTLTQSNLQEMSKDKES